MATLFSVLLLLLFVHVRLDRWQLTDWRQPVYRPSVDITGVELCQPSCTCCTRGHKSQIVCSSVSVMTWLSKPVSPMSLFLTGHHYHQNNDRHVSPAPGLTKIRESQLLQSACISTRGGQTTAGGSLWTDQSVKMWSELVLHIFIQDGLIWLKFNLINIKPLSE